MTERKKLDREVMEEAFRIMGQYLLDRKALGEIASEQRLRELARTIQSKSGG